MILSYTVTYRAIPAGHEQTKTFSAPFNNITLKHLSEFTDYAITVFASTIKGGGNISVPIIVRTDEDSKYANSHCPAKKYNRMLFQVLKKLILSLFQL